LSRNQQLLAQIQADAKVADTPEARLLSEIRGMEETLLGNHRQYARLWNAAEQLGIKPSVAMPGEILAKAYATLEPLAATPDPAHRAQFQTKDNDRGIDR